MELVTEWVPVDVRPVVVTNVDVDADVGLLFCGVENAGALYISQAVRYILIAR